MALFGSRKKNPLVRLKALDWKNEEERKALFSEILANEKHKLKEVIWTVTSAEPEIRQLGVALMPRFAGNGLAQALLLELNNKNEAQQRFLLRQIAKCPPDDVQECASELLGAPEPKRRKLGVMLINLLPPAKAAPLIETLLSDGSADVRLVGLNKVLADSSALQNERLRGLILPMANDSDERIRVGVYRTLIAAEERNKEIWDILTKGITDDSYTVQQMSSEVLGAQLKAGNVELEGSLIALLADGSTTVRTAVIKSLLQSPDRSRVIRKYLSYTRTLAGWVRERALESLKAFSRDLVEPVVELMHDDDEEIRLLALVVGGNFEDERCVEPIIGLLDDEDWWTRVTAAETLGRIGDKRAVPHLTKLLNDDEAKWTAIDALAEIGDPSSVSALSTFLKDPAAEIRLATLDALKSFDPSPEVMSALEDRARNDDNRTVRDRSMEIFRQLSERTGSGENMDELEAASRKTQAFGEVNELEKLLIEVRNRGGSDLHISVGSQVQMRVHGNLEPFGEERLTDARCEELVKSILTERQLEALERDLQLDFCYTIPNVGRYRSNVFLQRLGFGGVFRVIPGIPPTFRDIGMPDHMTDLVNYHQGLIIVAGPSGAGKSTTLAALVNLLNESKRSHVLTIEDPVEFVHPMKNCLVNQREVGKHTQSFANALKGALREDPDVIMVGEMRDNETVKMAMEAAETGHLVIATLSTTTAPKTVDRLIESFPPAEQAQVRLALSESLKAVICQTLVPKKGGKGRVAVFEILLGHMTVRAMIRDNKTYQLFSAMQMGRNKGMRTVDHSLYDLVQKELVDPEFAYIRCQDKEVFEPLVSASFLKQYLGGLTADDEDDANPQAAR